MKNNLSTGFLVGLLFGTVNHKASHILSNFGRLKNAPKNRDSVDTVEKFSDMNQLRFSFEDR